MILNKKNIIKITIFSLMMLAFAIVSIFYNVDKETNLLRTVLPASVFQNYDAKKMADKKISLIKVVFESSEQKDLVNLKNEFYNKLDKTSFEVIDFDFSQLLNYYLKHPTNFISPANRLLIQEGNYNSIADKAIFSLYHPVEVQLVDYEHDPFFLLSDYLKYVGWFHSIHHTVKSNDKNKKDDFLKLSKEDINSNITLINGDKLYDYQLLRIKSDDSLSIKKANKCVGELMKIKKELSSKDQAIYYAGTPIHSYYIAKDTTITICVISLLSILLIIALTIFYFKNLFVIIPITASIFFGYLTGFAITKLWFGNLHLATLLFATTLIGIGIDYSYHYLFHEDRGKKFIKDLSFSALTTTLAFLVLYFSKIGLLQQISVFTIFGLIAIYIFVVTIYPCFNMPKPQISLDFKVHKYIKYGILGFIALLAFVGFFRFRMNDSIAAIYYPSSIIKKSEIIYNNVSNMPVITPIVLKISGNNSEEILQNEEKITQVLDDKKIKYIALSKYIPSVKRQKENHDLAQKLYKNKLSVFNGFLSSTQINNLRNAPFGYSNFDINNFGLFREFILTDKENIIYIYSNKLPSIDGVKLSPIDINSVATKYMKLCRNILIVLFPIALAVIFGILCLAYKKKTATKMILAPLVAIITSVGIACLFGVKMNMFSLMALFLALGFTLDYSIFRLGGDKKSEDGILISCITTSFSFLALSFTSFRLISTLSFILFLGISISYILGRLFLVEDTEQI